MADEQPEQRGTGTGKAEGSTPGRSPIVFVGDATAETERIGDTLRAAGYAVVDVPLATLPARVTAQRPNVILIDIDAEAALDVIAQLRKLPGTGAIDFVHLGGGDGPIKNAEEALVHDGSAFFLRPIDVALLVRKIEALTGGPIARPAARSSNPPPPPPPPPPSSSLPPSRSLLGATLRDIPPGRPPSDRPSSPLPPSLPAPGLRTPGPPLPMSTTSLADLVDAPRSFASFGTVSHELQLLLAEAELQAEVLSASEMVVPTPDEEIEAVLPADVLASLDEPLDGDEEDDAGGEGRSGSSHDREGTGAHAKGTTSGGSRNPTTGTGAGRSASTGSQTHDRRLTSDTPPPRAVTSGAAGGSVMSERARSEAPRTELTRADSIRFRSDDSPPPRPSSWHPPPQAGSGPRAADPQRGPSVQAAPATGAAVILSPLDARRFFAEAVARRASGALCFESDGVVRRVVLRDGDLVAAASGGEQESLVHFLASRGELSREEAPRLAAKIPPYGRHAGAALVAHGWLRQDQLWAVLRAHAEWIASAILRLSRGSAQLEADPPGRLRGEPSVFGAATGPEIFVELVRRAVPADDALERLGGEGARLTDGPNHGLLAECNLSPQDLELIQRARGGTIADLLTRASDGEILSVLHALALLGILDAVPAPDFGRRGARSLPDAEVAALDEDAIRARVRARLELVEEGDYFSVLGVTRDATGYEVRRAFVELRRTFEPARLLDPRLLDLSDDVRKIVIVLEEAYEILRDGARRERYRRAIDARPE